MENKAWYDTNDAWLNTRGFPSLSHLTVFRTEDFGGILFNASLLLEEYLDLQEAHVVTLCDGHHAIADIIAATEKKFSLPEKEAKEKTLKVITDGVKRGAITISAFPAKRVLNSSQNNPVSGKKAMRSPKKIIWYITKKCNLLCRHCFIDGGLNPEPEFSTHDATKVIDALGQMKVLYLSFSGGEPFMRSDIFELAGYAADYGMRVDIATNGTLINRKLAKRIAGSKIFQVQVSIDGTEAVHDSFRGKKGAFSKSAEAVRRMLDAGVIVSISHTVRKGNINETQWVIDWAMYTGCAGIKLIPFFPVGRGMKNASEYMVSRKEIKQLYTMISAMRKYVPVGFHIYSEMEYGNDPEYQGRTGTVQVCPAGKESMIIYPDGTVFACPFLTDYPVGKLPEDQIEKIWNDAPVLKFLRKTDASTIGEPCRVCHYKTTCGGGCRAAAYCFQFSIGAADPYCLRSDDNT